MPIRTGPFSFVKRPKQPDRAIGSAPAVGPAAVAQRMTPEDDRAVALPTKQERCDRGARLRGTLAGRPTQLSGAWFRTRSQPNRSGGERVSADSPAKSRRCSRGGRTRRETIPLGPPATGEAQATASLPSTELPPWRRSSECLTRGPCGMAPTFGAKTPASGMPGCRIPRACPRRARRAR
jgi:hypothetical protein